MVAVLLKVRYHLPYLLISIKLSEMYQISRVLVGCYHQLPFIFNILLLKCKISQTKENLVKRAQRFSKQHHK